MSGTEDRRVRRTKKAMNEALASLLSEKALKHITVREIAERADINRGTFYLHYKDVYDMVEKLQNEIFERFNQIVDAHLPEEEEERLFPMLTELFQLLAENAELAQILIGRNGDAVFVDKLRNAIREKCFVNLRYKFQSKSEEEFTYFYQYIVAGCIGISSAWLAGGRTESPSELAAFTEKLVLNGAKALL